MKLHSGIFVAGVGALVLGSTAAGAERAVTVPIQILGNFPVVNATIEGNTVPLIFDLGDDSALVLSQAVIDRVKAMPTGETQRMKDLEGHVIQSPKFKIPRLQIGDALFTDVVWRRDAHDPAFPADEVGQQGYLGTSLLMAYRVVLDYRHRTMTLIPPESADSRSAHCKGAAVPFSPHWHGEPITTAHTDFGELTLVWDTGAPVSIIRKARAQAAGAVVSNDTVTTKRLILGGVDFGPLTFQQLEYAEPAGTDAFIGYDFFAKHVVCIDFPGKRFLIKK